MKAKKQITYVLTISNHFPTTHRRKGEPTNFYMFILRKLNITFSEEFITKYYNNAIIEICELQKQSSASEIKDLDYESWMRIMNSQNIAE